LPADDDRGIVQLAKPELGNKRQCQNCGAKFFDLNKDPILCPKCGATFQPPALSRAARAAAADDEESELPEAGAEIVSLEEADATDEKVAVVVDDDVDLGDDAADDADTFLEEEDSDDVTHLIDGDIETDEEA
jgi:uncharacterized protein (TIGR02300 family)